MKVFLKRIAAVSVLVYSVTLGVQADVRQLIPETTLKAFAEETSGVAAKRNLDQITLFHRTRASRQYHDAVVHIENQLKEYGFDTVEVMEFPADGKTMFGTQKSRYAWNVDFAELWLLDGEGNKDRRLASWDAMPLSVAQDSLSGAATASLVDIGEGTTDAHYEGLDIRGKLVLTESQPGAVADLAVGKYGAAGIVSYAPNQKTAWWKEDDRLVRWGHLSSFPNENAKTFGFMISLGEARKLQARLQNGEEVHLNAKIDAHHTVGTYELITATIDGADPVLKEQEIAFTCHLDHPRPGANDNASGCVAILESARAMKKLIDEGSLPRPKRTIRFIWPAEIEGSIIFLAARPDIAARIKANIHMDMVGGGLDSKAVFRIASSPYSVPSFIPDVGHAIGQFVNNETLAFASGLATNFPLHSAEGGKEPLMAIMEGFSSGSDHQVFNEGSWGIPGIYLHDWPDRYIHTNFDTAATIDPTKLKRASFVGSSTAWFLANIGAESIEPLLALLKNNAVARTAVLMMQAQGMNSDDRTRMNDVHWKHEAGKLDSLSIFLPDAKQEVSKSTNFLDELRAVVSTSTIAVVNGNAATVFTRNAGIKGPMSAFGYGYLEDKLNADERSLVKLSGTYAYEALNLVNGKRTVQDIRDVLSAQFGLVSVSDVYDYLSALESINVISR
ncbi:M28 family peptidase [Kordiimonas aquimaris]|uniref:M28 family peptidase n=1 Tax=Kordiimonas aquimaris TaxID=707591 RepID=UPI0021D05F63|nr:M28 family peptidase [Kordiimonas aquimaris]